MANLEGIIHALKKKIAHLDLVIEELGGELGNTTANLAEAQNILRSLKNPDMLLDGAPVTLSRLQVMENGDIRVVLPPPPPAPDPDTCIQSKTGKSGKNGKKDEKELANVSGL